MWGLPNFLIIMLWIPLMMIPPINLAGEWFLRKANKESMKKRWWMWILVMIPYAGPILSILSRYIHPVKFIKFLFSIKPRRTSIGNCVGGKKHTHEHTH